MLLLIRRGKDGFHSLANAVVSFTDARNTLKTVLDQVVNDADYTVITHRDADDAVVMSLDYCNGRMKPD